MADKANTDPTTDLNRGPKTDKPGRSALDALGQLTESLGSVTGNAAPPIHLWNPAHCGDIDIEIRADGSWWHEGSQIRRMELVKLFASILRREDDGCYYLITPVEKARIRVELHPLVVIDFETVQGVEPSTVMLFLNTGGQIPLDADHPLALEPKAAGAAFVQVDRGLTALFSRAAWYRLVDALDETGSIESAGQRFQLSTDTSD